MPASALDAYLASLPSGLDGSFTDCQAKGSLLRESLVLRPLRAETALPPSLAQYIARPPLASAWVPETHYVALSLATADQYAMDRAGFIAFWREVMLALTDKTYAVLLGLAHPETLLRGTSARWAQFHTGSTLTAQRNGPHFEVEMRFRKGILPELIVDGYVGVVQGLVDRSRLPQARAERSGLRHEGDYSFATYRIGGW